MGELLLRISSRLHLAHVCDFGAGTQSPVRLDLFECPRALEFHDECLEVSHPPPIMADSGAAVSSPVNVEKRNHGMAELHC